RRRLLSFDEEQRERAQRLDALRFQSEEIFEAQLQPGEEETLRSERARLANAEKLGQSAAEAFMALEGDPSDPAAIEGGLDRLRDAETALDDFAGVDESVEQLPIRLREALFILEVVASEVRAYAETLQAEPQLLTEIDERLELIRTMKRKY